MSNPWFVARRHRRAHRVERVLRRGGVRAAGRRRHRLEDAAPTSRSARAALRSSSELTVLLAGSQLGITVCTLALGAITKPAVHHWLTPLFEAGALPLWRPTSPASCWR